MTDTKRRMRDSHITAQWNLTISKRRDIARNSVWLNMKKGGNGMNNNVIGKDKGYAVCKGYVMGNERNDRKKSSCPCCATAATMRFLTAEWKTRRKQKEE